MKLSVFWFRRDLRLDDNIGLDQALKSGNPVLPIFIFDTNIIEDLDKDDARITFIYDRLQKINSKLNKIGSALTVLNGKPNEVWLELLQKYDIEQVYVNKDYEPYARERDASIKDLISAKGIAWKAYKDQVIFEEAEVVKADLLPYTVFTPYKKKWLANYQQLMVSSKPCNVSSFYQYQTIFPGLEKLGFTRSAIKVKDFDLTVVKDYASNRDYPHLDATSYLGPHLRFGTIGIRTLIQRLPYGADTFLSELIWREFFMQIIWHFPHVVQQCFKPKYECVKWLNRESDFELWCQGKTGYPIVDAGMRQLNQTGYMHNRVRMVVASFLCKHLLIDWRWGEAYFAQKLLDYELSSNNGNWQWAAGTGCDAAPYFRVFNPTAQQVKFDKKNKYVEKWVPEWLSFEYSRPMVDHQFARDRALRAYKDALAGV